MEEERCPQCLNDLQGNDKCPKCGFCVGCCRI
jgi:hypothetical protein